MPTTLLAQAIPSSTAGRGARCRSGGRARAAPLRCGTPRRSARPRRPVARRALEHRLSIEAGRIILARDRRQPSHHLPARAERHLPLSARPGRACARARQCSSASTGPGNTERTHRTPASVLGGQQSEHPDASAARRGRSARRTTCGARTRDSCAAGSDLRSPRANRATSSCENDSVRSIASGLRSRHSPAPVASASRRSAPRAGRRPGSRTENRVSSSCTIRIWASESQPSTVPGRSSSPISTPHPSTSSKASANARSNSLVPDLLLVGDVEAFDRPGAVRDVALPAVVPVAAGSEAELGVEVGDEARCAVPARSTPRRRENPRAVASRPRCERRWISAVRPITRQLRSSVSITAAAGIVGARGDDAEADHAVMGEAVLELQGHADRPSSRARRSTSSR